MKQTRLGDYKLIKMDRQKFIRPDRQMVRISREKLIIPEREAATQRMLAGLQRETKTADIAKTEKTANENIAEAVNAANKNIENAVNTAATEHLQTKQPEIAEAANKPENSIVLACEIDEVINYALVHNGASVVRDICIKNTSETERNALLLKIASDGELMEDFVCGIEALPAGEELHFKNLALTCNVGYLASITEKFSNQLTVTVLDGENVLASEKINITVMAFDEFPGFQYTPELLTAFAMPNHPAVVSLIRLASKYLEKWTGNPSLDGYQSGDQERVKNMAAAAYAAIQQKNITYASAASFEACGQRVRLADAVLEQHLGNCMDLTLLYTACLEAMDLNPFMVVVEGHIFAGVWLVDGAFADILVDDPSQLEKRMAKGIQELMVVECTAMCSGQNVSFDEAAAMARRRVSNYGKFYFAIDVKRARSRGIRPLPVRVQTANGFEVLHEDRKEKEVTGASDSKIEVFDFSDCTEKTQVTKLTQWERKLLDLSLRNMLINMRVTKSVVPVLSADIGSLEDALFDGEAFQVMSRPANVGVNPAAESQIELLNKLGELSEFISFESKHKRLYSIYSEKDLSTSLTKMYRSAKASLEENGASTLYLALGVLRWFERKKNAPARYAPIVLVPIDIVRKSAGRGYAMQMRDEDSQINITLLEFLKQNYEITIPGINPPPQDEHGLDMPKIFALIRKAVMSLEMWDVLEVAVIGNFSFSQFVMWNDIHNNKDFLEKNKIVHSLIEGAVDWDCTIPEDVDREDAYLPVTADASQLHAINMAAAGVSFVLHGPPGTGKSQTITALIANALTKGKTVLFVAEKRAALEVVQKRLAALGIDDFCLELHSNKATKKAVLNQLRRGLEIGIEGAKTDYEQKISDIHAMRTELDAYAKALHKKRNFGRSLRQLIDLYESIPEEKEQVKFSESSIAKITESNLNSQKNNLERLISAGRAIGHPYQHPLAAVRKAQYSQHLKTELEPVMRTYLSVLDNIQAQMADFAASAGIKNPVTKAEWNQVSELIRCMESTEKMPAFLRTTDSVEREFSVPEEYLKKREKFEQKKAEVLSKWNENFLSQDMSTYHVKYEEANKKVFFLKGKAQAALTAELQLFAGFTVETEQIPLYLTEITAYQQEERKMEAAEADLSYDWKQILKQYQTKEELQSYKIQIQNQRQSMARFAGQIREAEAKGILSALVQKGKALFSTWNAMEVAERNVAGLLELAFHDEDSWIERRRALCRCVLENAAALKDWIVYQQNAELCRKSGLAPICDAYEKGLPHDEVLNVYLRSIYRAIILGVIESEPVLNGFTGTGFQVQIEQFKKLDQECMQLTKEEMFYRLASQLPAVSDSVEVSRELNYLRRAISSNGRGISIRGLFEQIPHILPGLCPCMLMSPISAAQYLKAENDLFDIVVFDEASQLPTCKAVGVLARGKNAVIVGDPNQMPPTSFFAGNSVDEDNLDIEDLDSILDDCLALGMPSAHLQWHYRSRHESLIAFSNREFYENSMLTFPSVNDRQRRVSMVKVEGFFDRGKSRVNEGEAQAIVAEIKKRYADSEKKKQTIGVVTFNVNQQTLIEDLLQEEYQKDLDFDKWANMGEEPLFVKNLENVQGDERDVILFSVAFGPDAEGKLSMNFGPLNRDGGWKRLNVAVSRARCEMVVFSIMMADQINLRRTKAKGVESLKYFMEFAQNGKLRGDYRQNEAVKNQGIKAKICRALANAGYKYQLNVGHSKFKVDIAVINPDHPEEYLLGIMTDGDSYCQSTNTKDREVAQFEVLKGLGWKLYRIWTMDWWDDPQKEITKLLGVLEMRKKEEQ